MNERGTALVAALVVAMILLPLGTYVAMQCRTDLLIQRNVRTEVEAFYVAEAGLEHAVSEIRPGLSFDAVLAGPDRIAGTADDGVFPFVEGPPAQFPYAPYRYDVRASSSGTGRINIVSQGVGKSAATRTVAALVARLPVPFTPAALHVESDATRLNLGSNGFLLSGFDHRTTDAATTPTGSAAPLPALGDTSSDAEATLRDRPSGADNLVGAGGPPSIATVPALDVRAYAAAAASRPENVVIANVAAGESPVLGTATTPQLSLIVGDCDVAGQLTGSGILTVQGTLHVSGSLAFSGLILALGGVVFAPGSDVTVNGALWRGAGVDDRLDLEGTGAITYSSSTLSVVDAAFPSLLPHRAVVVGWQEQL